MAKMLTSSYKHDMKKREIVIWIP